MSLDGFLAGPRGEVDWILDDPAMEMEEFFVGYDAMVMGRGTYEAMLELGGDFMGMEAYVCSTTLGSDDCPGATVTRDPVGTVGELKDAEGKDIWLFGGGVLARTLFDAELVDGVDVAVIPVVLGAGLPLVAGDGKRVSLRLRDERTYPSGILFLRYDVVVTRS